MNIPKVVVGAGFGDCSKGKHVDYLCSLFTGPEPMLNIRFNSSAQAGHTTVVDNIRHVFHHFGSGSFNPKVETFLSKHFVCNPLAFSDELLELNKKGVYPRVFVDQLSKITTPYDMMINQMLEESRGDNRHGSCGLGFNETIERSKFIDFEWTAGQNIDFARNKLTSILARWVPKRMEQLGLRFGENVGAEWESRIHSKNVFDAFLENLETFYHNVKIVDYYPNLFQRYNNRMVFEGAQGLMLDANSEFFPHVTRSNTGIENVIELLSSYDGGPRDIDVIYVTRPYATRHGAGPFPHEKPDLSYEDLTNKPNPWQGSLRFGLLDLKRMKHAIKEDILHSDGSGILVNATIAVSCLDQIKETDFYAIGDDVYQFGDYDKTFLVDVGKILPVSHLSFGPTRKDIVCVSG